MKGVSGPGYSGMMVGFNQIQGAGAKIQRAFAPSTEHRVVGMFGLLQDNAPSYSSAAGAGSASFGVKGLMVNIFA